MQDFKVDINGLIVGVDWLSFTVHAVDGVDDIITFMGFDLTDFKEMPSGSHGYKRMKKHENISVLYDGAENMGIHVNITGSSITTLLEAYNNTLLIETGFGTMARDVYTWEETTLSRFCLEVLKIGHFTRIDLAIDDHGMKYYSLDEIADKIARGRIVSKWRTYQDNKERIIADNEKVGQTMYFGSKQSDIQMRIYDKKLERNKGLSIDDESYIHEDRIRWELQLRDERAEETARQLSNNMLLGEVAIGILSNYFRIIKLDDSNKSRCSLESKWERFVNKVSKLRITVVKEVKTLDEQMKQFEHQEGRRVCKYLYANGGDVNSFVDLAQRFECKLTPRDREELGLIDN